ncbi:uncharacterized protein LOC131250677 [Magnolia sinica]|uniref:uncharacterized protein LOC131250677 n=1 Tax=Magnolia sinica TaxID=86752 RepID=UPI0026599236|nr:uncharacterized protein LOC131250677 [Magnolia sinica]
MQVSHLLFTDDTLLFLNEGIHSVRSAKQFLDLYQQAFGQKANFHKSVFMHPENMAASRIAAIQRELGSFTPVTSMVYLGSPSRRVEGGKTLFRDLWNGLMAGLRVGKRGSSLCWRVDLRTFFGVGRMAGKKLLWRSWQFIALPKSERGLGIRHLQDVMIAFRLKMAWTAMNSVDSGLWASFMRTRYSQDLEWGGQQNLAPLVSPLWKRIRALLPSIKASTQWQIGEGNLHLWKDNWSGLGPLQDSLSTTIPSALLEFKVKDFLGQMGPFPPLAVFSVLSQHHIDAIFHGGFCVTDGADTPFWTPNPSGKFSVSSAWEIGHACSPQMFWGGKI